MILLFPIFVAFLVVFSPGVAVRVAIIGGGIGGAASAYFLRKHAPPETKIAIHLFNNGNIGGRLRTVQMQYNGKTRFFEAGGSILHPANAYFNNWLEEFGNDFDSLNKKETPNDKGVMGLWNGNELVFMKSSSYLIMLYRLYKRYGFDPLKIRFEIRSLLSDFENLYEHFEKRQSFDTIDTMAMAMSTRLANLLNITIKDHLRDNGYHDQFIMEYAASVLNVNYMQSVEVQFHFRGFAGTVITGVDYILMKALENLHAFVGSVGLAGSVPGLYSVNGSNKLVVEKLINYAKAELTSAEVSFVSKRSNHFILFGNDGREVGADYDYVIVAVPLHQKQLLQIQGANLEDQRGKYKHVVATFVEGSLNVSYWSASEGDMLSAVFVCSTDEPFKSIGQISPVDYEKDEPFPTVGSHRVWKLFSTKELSKSQLALYFNEIRDVKEVTFLAYPDYKYPPPGRPRFRLAKHVCYANAIEWLASSIEMSAMGGANCVNMLLNDLGLLEDNGTKKTEL